MNDLNRVQVPNRKTGKEPPHILGIPKKWGAEAPRLETVTPGGFSGRL